MRQTTHTITGPGVEHPVESAEAGLSGAISFANNEARQRIEASFYVRDENDNVVGRADSFEDGSVTVYGPRQLAAAA